MLGAPDVVSILAISKTGKVLTWSVFVDVGVLLVTVSDAVVLFPQTVKLSPELLEQRYRIPWAGVNERCLVSRLGLGFLLMPGSFALQKRLHGIQTVFWTDGCIDLYM